MIGYFGKAYFDKNRNEIDNIITGVREEMDKSRTEENSREWTEARAVKHLGENVDSNQGRGRSGSMLDLANTDGQVAIALLRKKCNLDTGRSIVIRVQESDGRQWIWEAIPSENEKEPIYLHLSGQHFQTLIKKEELSANQ